MKENLPWRNLLGADSPAGPTAAPVQALSGVGVVGWLRCFRGLFRFTQLFQGCLTEAPVGRSTSPTSEGMAMEKP